MKIKQLTAKQRNELLPFILRWRAKATKLLSEPFDEIGLNDNLKGKHNHISLKLIFLCNLFDVKTSIDQHNIIIKNVNKWMHQEDMTLITNNTRSELNMTMNFITRLNNRAKRIPNYITKELNKYNGIRERLITTKKQHKTTVYNLQLKIMKLEHTEQSINNHLEEQRAKITQRHKLPKESE